MASLLMLICCLILLAGWITDIPTNAYALRAILSVVLTVWCLIVSGLVGALVALHTYLIIVGKTTSEFFRERKVKPAASSVTMSADSDKKKKIGKSSWSRPIEATAALVAPIQQCTDCVYNRANSCIERKNYAAVDRQQNPHGLIAPLRSTRLLPLWQFENVEDIFLQDDLTDIVLERYNILKVELATPGSPISSPLLSPDSAPVIHPNNPFQENECVHDSYLQVGERSKFFMTNGNRDFTPTSPVEFERTALRRSDSLEHKQDEEEYQNGLV